jgi:hypothetical protein
MARQVFRSIAAAVLVLAGGACGSSVPAVPSASPQPRSGAFEEFGAAFCGAFGELFTAIGNPDTGGNSALYDALLSAVKHGDIASADRIAATITEHLEAGRRHAAAAARWESAGPMMAELDRVFLAFEAMVGAVRKSATGNTDVNVGQTAFEQAGGVQAWRAMFVAGSGIQRPPGVGNRPCPDVPISY